MRAGNAVRRNALGACWHRMQLKCTRKYVPAQRLHNRAYQCSRQDSRTFPLYANSESNTVDPLDSI